MEDGREKATFDIDKGKSKVVDHKSSKADQSLSFIDNDNTHITIF